ncbi:MAG: hypothetical protein AAF942_07765 [Pseudomonadota bacterium]
MPPQDGKPNAIFRKRVNRQDIGEKHDVIGECLGPDCVVGRDARGDAVQPLHLFSQCLVDIVPTLQRSIVP